MSEQTKVSEAEYLTALKVVAEYRRQNKMPKATAAKSHHFVIKVLFGGFMVTSKTYNFTKFRENNIDEMMWIEWIKDISNQDGWLEIGTHDSCRPDDKSEELKSILSKYFKNSTFEINQ